MTSENLSEMFTSLAGVEERSASGALQAACDITYSQLTNPADLLIEGQTIWAIIDGAKIDGLPERLAGSDLQHFCLFPGDAFEDAAQAAPWLVSLPTAEGLAAQLLSTDPDTHWSVWAHGAGVFVQSDLPGKRLAQNLRRMVLRRDGQGRRVFHRFWDPTMVFDYYQAIAILPERATAVFHSEGGGIQRIVAHDTRLGTVTSVAPAPQLPTTGGRFDPILDPRETAALLAGLLRPYAVEIARTLGESDPAIVGHLPEHERIQCITESCVRLHYHGFRKIHHLKELALQDIWIGQPFEQKDETLLVICRSAQSEDQKFAALSSAIADLEAATGFQP